MRELLHVPGLDGQRVVVSAHALMRMGERRVSFDDLRRCLQGRKLSAVSALAPSPPAGVRVVESGVTLVVSRQEDGCLVIATVYRA
jgi:hypothetical protein